MDEVAFALDIAVVLGIAGLVGLGYGVFKLMFRYSINHEAFWAEIEKSLRASQPDKAKALCARAPYALYSHAIRAALEATPNERADVFKAMRVETRSRCWRAFGVLSLGAFLALFPIALYVHERYFAGFKGVAHFIIEVAKAILEDPTHLLSFPALALSATSMLIAWAVVAFLAIHRHSEGLEARLSPLLAGLQDVKESEHVTQPSGFASQPGFIESRRRSSLVPPSNSPLVSPLPASPSSAPPPPSPAAADFDHNAFWRGVLDIIEDKEGSGSRASQPIKAAKMLRDALDEGRAGRGPYQFRIGSDAEYLDARVHVADEVSFKVRLLMSRSTSEKKRNDVAGIAERQRLLLESEAHIKARLSARVTQGTTPNDAGGTHAIIFGSKKSHGALIELLTQEDARSLELSDLGLMSKRLSSLLVTFHHEFKSWSVAFHKREDYPEWLAEAPEHLLAAAWRVKGRIPKTLVLKKGSKGEVTASVVRLLQELGYYKDVTSDERVNATYGPKCRSAIKALQRDVGLSVDGQCGPETFKALCRQATLSQPASDTPALSTTSMAKAALAGVVGGPLLGAASLAADYVAATGAAEEGSTSEEGAPYRDLYRQSLLDDGTIDERERVALADLAAELDISARVVRQIQREVEEEPEVQAAIAQRASGAASAAGLASSVAPVRDGIFINYRRSDTEWPARDLDTKLVARFGRDRVFKDLDSIGLSENFWRQITQGIERSKIMLTLIGPNWFNAENRARLHDPEDFVRREIEAAYAEGVTVIPLWLSGGKTPAKEALPESLQPLTLANAQQMGSTRDFDARVEGLIRSLASTLDDA